MDASSLADPVALLGEWGLSRAVEDHLAGERHRIEGRLTLIAEEPGRLRWAESGRWFQPTGEVEVHRLLWLVRDPPTQWWVRFEDGRDFHPWTPGEEVVHPCSPDTYRGVVTGSVERWTVRWDVSGPRKDYTMTTVLTPGPTTGR